MKKAVMQVSIASPTWSYYPGQEVTLTDELAAAWEECGHAKIIGDAPDEDAPVDASTSETDGDKDEPESNNTASSGTTKSGRGKKKSEN